MIKYILRIEDATSSDKSVRIEVDGFALLPVIEGALKMNNTVHIIGRHTYIGDEKE